MGKQWMIKGKYTICFIYLKPHRGTAGLGSSWSKCYLFSESVTSPSFISAWSLTWSTKACCQERCLTSTSLASLHWRTSLMRCVVAVHTGWSLDVFLFFPTLKNIPHEVCSQVVGFTHVGCSQFTQVVFRRLRHLPFLPHTEGHPSWGV